jgi:hypothetical protein
MRAKELRQDDAHLSGRRGASAGFGTVTGTLPAGCPGIKGPIPPPVSMSEAHIEGNHHALSIDV